MNEIKNYVNDYNIIKINYVGEFNESKDNCIDFFKKIILRGINNSEIIDSQDNESFFILSKDYNEDDLRGSFYTIINLYNYGDIFKFDKNFKEELKKLG